MELGKEVLLLLTIFIKQVLLGECTGISFVDSTMIPVCHNLRRYTNKVFKGMATNGKGTIGWCHGCKLHLLCNDSGDINAQEKMHHRVHQRPVKEQGQPRAFKNRSVNNFIMNLISALGTYCFFENKPQAMPVHVEHIAQLTLF